MKSRNISILDYFNQLQLEYFCAELRSKIYTKQTDKDYWKTIMQHKQNKIEDISLRNKLKSIFTDKHEYQKVFDKILCWGIPEFQYRDYYQESRLKNRDLYFYFQPGSDVKVKDGVKEYTGKIKSYDLENNFIVLENNNQIKIENVCRIV